MNLFQKTKKIAVIAAVMIVPLLYSYFYLYAFWDPYKKLSDLPVAVVTEDKGANLKGEYKNFGTEITDKLSTDDNLKWVVTDKNEAENGLLNRKYYAEILIPEDFSSKLATLDSADKVQGLIIYKVNEKRNFLAGQVLNRVIEEFKTEVSGTVTEEITKNLADNLEKVPSDLQTLNDGIKKVNDGTATLSDKSNDLVDGLNKFDAGVNQVYNGITDAREGSGKLVSASSQLSDGANQFSQQLSSGAQSIQELKDGSTQFANGLNQVGEGVAKLNNGLNQLSASGDKIKSGTENLSNGMNQFNSSFNKYIEARNKIDQTYAAVYSGLNKLAQNNPELAKNIEFQTALKTLEKLDASTKTLQSSENGLKTATSQLNESSQKLSAGTGQFIGGLKTVTDSTSQLMEGTKRLQNYYLKIDQGILQVKESIALASNKSMILSNGMKKLSDGIISLDLGLNKLSNGSYKLSTEHKKIVDGGEQFKNGLTSLHDGVSEISEKVEDAANTASKDVTKLNGIDEYAKEPINLNTDKVDSVPDYGTAFTPYFVSLSLWVGAILIFFAIYLDPRYRLGRLLSKFPPIVQHLGYTLIGIGQAIILVLVLRYGLHLEARHPELFYLVCFITALSFTEIMRFLMVGIGEVGKFLAVLFLILQLTACGGTFPMELVPEFFQKLNPFMPMTYTVNAMKESISGNDYNFLVNNLLVLLLFMIVSVILTAIITHFRKKSEIDEIEEEEIFEAGTISE